MKMKLEFITVRNTYEDDGIIMRSGDDLRQFVCTIKFRGNDNYAALDCRKYTYSLYTRYIIKNPDNIQSVEGTGYLKPRNGEVHYCIDKTGVTNLENTPISQRKFVHVYNMDGKYYKVFPQFESQLHFYVMDKLEYQADIEKRFQKKHVRCPVNKDVWPEKYPAKPYLCYDCGGTVYDLGLTELSTNDIVVDRNMNQIWPTATKQPPVELIKMLTPEKVH